MHTKPDIDIQKMLDNMYRKVKSFEQNDTKIKIYTIESQVISGYDYFWILDMFRLDHYYDTINIIPWSDQMET